MKLLYMDTETTGLDAQKHGLTQIAAIVVIDGEEIDRIVLDINPFTYGYDVDVEDKALEITGKTVEMISAYPDQWKQHSIFIEFLENHVADRNRKDVFQIAGYNTSFDIGFIKRWFDVNEVYFSRYFSYKDVDVFALVKHFRLFGLLDGCKDDKLGTVCEYYGIELDAHDAMNDIVATRELYRHLVTEYITTGVKV